MNTQLLNNVSNFFKPAVEATVSLSRLNAATVEKVANLQLAAVQANAELVVANLKAGTEVTDLDGAKAYATRQNEIARSVYERLVADGKALVGIAQDYSAEANKLVKSAVPATPAPVATPKAKKAA